MPVNVTVPEQEAAEFAARLKTDQYRKDERDYKVAVHKVISALLSDANANREDFPALIANVFSEPIPDLDALGLSAEDQLLIKNALGTMGAGALRSAMANLTGGKFGLAQFIWIPRAIEFGLGQPIAAAFRDLINPSVPLPQRIDTFRDEIYTVMQALEQKGGFLPNWQLFRVSLSFVALVLTGYDPAQFSFYSRGALRYSYEHYAVHETWPKGTMGEIYAEVCGFVQEVADALKAHGVPVADLIDAQSFLWLGFRAQKAVEPTTKPKTGAVEDVDPEAVAKDLATAAFWPIDRARHLVSLAQRWGQLLFQGPPGTSKTFVAERLARLLAGDEEGRVEVVQFHPSYAYEDFVEGIRPRVTEGSELAYEVRKGIFMKLVERAKEYPQSAFFLLIDELNRANLPRVLGELLYALEYRGAEHTFRLPYSGAETYIPSNITIISTMNTADRSIALVDAAIRRRFRHVDFLPDPAVLKAWLGAHALGELADHAAGRLIALNDQLLGPGLLDSDRLVGHTYLMREDLGEVGLEAVWDEDIEPVLREHLFNQPEEIIKLRETFLASE